MRHRRLRRCPALLLIALLSATAAGEAEQGPPASRPTAADEAGEPDGRGDEITPDAAARQRGVDAFLTILGEQEYDSPAVFALRTQRTQRKIVGHKEVEYRYTRQIRTVPIWKNITKPVETLAPVRQSATIVIKKVVRRKVVKRIKVGERKVERLVRDPDGDIVRTVRRPVYGPGPDAPDIEPIGWTGNNAMALYALLEAGVTPAEHYAVERLADTLHNHLRGYGISDYTWDIAWAAAAFARYPGRDYDTLLNQLLGRLLAGQSPSMKARGLWGPVCVNLDHLTRVLEEVAKVEAYAKEVAALAKRVKDKADPRRVKAAENLRDAREAMAYLFRRVTRNGLTFAKATKPSLIQNPNDFSDPGLMVAGWPYNLYHETLADLQSTALAVFALRVAHDHGKLPRTFSFPRLRSLKKTPLVRPIHTHPALIRTLTRLASAQKATTGWDEMIVWEPTTRFARLPESVMGLPIEVPKSVASRDTPICDALAVAAMDDLMAILGPTYRAKHGPRVTAAREQLARAAEMTFAIPRPLPRKPTTLAQSCRGFDPVAGGTVEPYHLLCQWRLGAQPAGGDPQRVETYTRMMKFLLSHQRPDGLWRSPDSLHGASTPPAVREFLTRRIGQMMAEWKQEKRRRVTEVHGLTRLAPARVWKLSDDDAHRRATAYAILTLSRICGPALDDPPE